MESEGMGPELVPGAENLDGDSVAQPGETNREPVNPLLSTPPGQDPADITALIRQHVTGERVAAAPQLPTEWDAADPLGNIERAFSEPALLESLLADPEMAPIVAKIAGERALDTLDELRRADPVLNAPESERAHVREAVNDVAAMGLESELARFEHQQLGRPITAQEERGTMDLIGYFPSLTVAQAYGASQRLAGRGRF